MRAGAAARSEAEYSSVFFAITGPRAGVRLTQHRTSAEYGLPFTLWDHAGRKASAPQRSRGAADGC